MSDYAPTSIRLEPELKDRLVREARINGRTLSAEITLRLKQTLEGQQPLAQLMRAEEPQAGGVYVVPALSDSQRLLLGLFSALSPEKQLALLTFLKR